MLKMIEEQKKTAKSVEEAIQPIIQLLENPPQQAISAFKEGIPLSLDDPSFDQNNAHRLYNTTTQLLHNINKTEIR